jgi:hypothetical protein
VELCVPGQVAFEQSQGGPAGRRIEPSCKSVNLTAGRVTV